MARLTTLPLVEEPKTIAEPITKKLTNLPLVDEPVSNLEPSLKPQKITNLPLVEEPTKRNLFSKIKQTAKNIGIGLYTDIYNTPATFITGIQAIEKNYNRKNLELLSEAGVDSTLIENFKSNPTGLKDLSSYLNKHKKELAPEIATKFSTKLGSGFASLPKSLIPGVIAVEVYGQSYEDAIAQGKDEETAHDYAGKQALWQEITERLGSKGLAKIIGSGKNIVTKMGLSALSESTQEFGQEALAKGIELAYGIKNNTPTFDRLLTAWGIGGITGGVATGGYHAAAKTVEKLAPEISPTPPAPAPVETITPEPQIPAIETTKVIPKAKAVPAKLTDLPLVPEPSAIIESSAVEPVTEEIIAKSKPVAEEIAAIEPEILKTEETEDKTTKEYLSKRRELEKQIVEENKQNPIKILRDRYVNNPIYIAKEDWSDWEPIINKVGKFIFTKNKTKKANVEIQNVASELGSKLQNIPFTEYELLDFLDKTKLPLKNAEIKKEAEKRLESEFQYNKYIEQERLKPLIEKFKGLSEDEQSVFDTIDENEDFQLEEDLIVTGKEIKDVINKIRKSVEQRETRPETEIKASVIEDTGVKGILEEKEKSIPQGIGFSLSGQYVPLTEPLSLPKQEEIPQIGNYNYVKTDDGSIYFGEEPHALLVMKQKIPPERVINGGFIENGELIGKSQQAEEIGGTARYALQEFKKEANGKQELPQGQEVIKEIKQEPTLKLEVKPKEKKLGTEAIDEAELFKLKESEAQRGSIIIPDKIEITYNPAQNKFIKLIEKYFTAKGLFPQKVYDELGIRKGKINAILREASYNLADFNKSLKIAYKGSKLTEKQKFELDLALKDQKDLTELPEIIREPLTKLRTHVDQLSKKLIESGAFDEEMIPYIESNMGKYLMRTYRVHSDPKWAENVDEAVKNKAKNFIKQEYLSRGQKLSQEEIDGIIDELLFDFDSGPMAMLAKGTKAGSKILDILQERKSIPAEIRALWGEYKEADVNYIRSVENMAQLLASQEFLTTIREEGLGKFFFEKPIVKDNVSYSSQLESEKSKVFAPLNGIYTSKDIKEAFETFYQTEQAPTWLRHYMKIVGASKYSKTILNQVTHIRNFVSGSMFKIMQGHFGIKSLAQAAKTIKTDLGFDTNTTRRELAIELTKLGIFDESVTAGELEDVVKDATGGNIDKYIDKGTRGLIRKGFRVIEKAYQEEDNFWKVTGYLDELARYKKAKPNWSEVKLKQVVAENIKNTYQNYGRVSRAVKGFRKIPIIAPFVSFPAEMMRTSYHTIRLISKELKDPDLRKIGALRLVGMLIAMSYSAALSIATRFLFGITKDEENSMRSFMPFWAKNSQFVWLGKDDDGNYKFVDLSFQDPYNYLKKPIIAFMRGENWEQSLLMAGVEASSPFISEDIITSKLLDIKRNVNPLGKRIYNPEDEFEQQISDVLLHVWEGVEPGVITSMKRVTKSFSEEDTSIYGRKYDPKLELLAATGGLRLSALNPKIALQYKAYEFNKKRIDATRVGGISNFEKKEEATNKAYENFSYIIDDARKLGLREGEIFEILKDSNISGNNAKAIMYKNYENLVKKKIYEKRYKYERERNR